MHEPGEGPHRSPLPLVLLAVFAAGVLGTAARLAIDSVFPVHPGGVLVSTLVVNTAGSFALGVVVGVLPRHSPEWLRAGLGAGLLGSFTTFSAITVASVALTDSDMVVGSAIRLIASVGTGIVAAVAGLGLAARVRRRR
jgi:fluoride exporter